MKIKSTFAIMITATIMAGGCSKPESPCSNCASYATNTPPTVTNTPPVANAGTDTILFSSNNRVTLSGSAVDKESNITSYKWKKISGPASYSFIDSTRLVTQVTNLVSGYYAFQLTVTDHAGLKDSAIVRIAVNPAAAATKEIIFYDLIWACPWGCSISVTSPSIPTNGVIAVFILRRGKWILTGDRDMPGYDYTYEQSSDGSMWVWSNLDEIYGDTADMKIIY